MAEDGPLSQADIDALTAGLLGDATGGALDTLTLRPEADAILESGSNLLSGLLNRHAELSVQDIKEADPESLTEGLDSDCLLVRLPFDQGFPGEMCLLVRKETSALLCSLMMGGDGMAPYKEEDADTLNEFGNQFISSVCMVLGPRFGVSVSAGHAQTGNFEPNQPPFGLEGGALVDASLSIEGFPETKIRLLLSPPLASKLAGGSERSLSHGTGGMTTEGGFDDSMSRNLSDSPPNIQMLLDINLNVTIELGRTRLSIRKVLELGPGSIIELDRLAGEPVDLLVNDKVVAKGEVVVVDEYFGIRIISLVSPEERIKQLK